MQPARHGAYTQLAEPLRHLLSDLTVQLAPITPIHALAEGTGVRVAIVVGVVGGVGVTGILLVSAVHSLSLLLYLNYSRKFVTSQVQIYYNFVNLRAGQKVKKMVADQTTIRPVPNPVAITVTWKLRHDL